MLFANGKRAFTKSKLNFIIHMVWNPYGLSADMDLELNIVLKTNKQIRRFSVLPHDENLPTPTPTHPIMYCAHTHTP